MPLCSGSSLTNQSWADAHKDDQITYHEHMIHVVYKNPQSQIINGGN
jgi:hypothetical protein